MEAIILAGGFGTRLRKLVSDLPKPMAPIGGRPFLEILLNSLVRKGFHRVILSLGFMSEKIIDYFGNNYEKMEIVYVVEEYPLGTGGGIRLAMNKVRSDHVFVFNGDTFLDLEIERVEAQWQRDNRPLIVGCEVSNAERYGRLLIDNRLVTGFTEKGIGGKGLINAGCYVLNHGQLDAYPSKKPFSLESDYLDIAISDGKFDVFVTREMFIDIGVPEDYLKAHTMLADFK